MPSYPHHISSHVHLTDNHNRLVADILTRYRTLMMLATVQAEQDRNNANPEAMAVTGISIKMEFDGLVRSPLLSPSFMSYKFSHLKITLARRLTFSNSTPPSRNSSPSPAKSRSSGSLARSAPRTAIARRRRSSSIRTSTVSRSCLTRWRLPR